MTTDRAQLRNAPAADLAALYTYNVAWSWEEQCYVATVDGWAGLSADAPTVKDALKEASFLVQAHIENYRTLGMVFPLPSVGAAPGRATKAEVHDAASA
ncbi:MAG: hypothetical protein AB2A00_13405 [Myxococcota bacterium]